MAEAGRGFRVRQPRPSDLEALLAIHGDPRTNRHNPRGPLRDREEGRALLEEWIDDWRRCGIGYWTVTASPDVPGETGAPGEVGARGNPGGGGPGSIAGFGGPRYLAAGSARVFNLYYRFAPDRWGRGWASALARHAVGAAHRADRGTPVIARMEPANRASERVAEKAGLAFAGHDRNGRRVLADRPVAEGFLADLPP
ncbi:GNAT family N-acetyltransferase [Salinifilum ghardaiensis]